ncbi:hypothetical protein NDU88_000402 [Pleurodeles waltl]|uniref:Uncharacterized protein n=1 Tax=Pleurodeles waltl TaxID=8319 RepID=A0AAV7UQY3_PLEWA|nr:hypothetical protein NDU88_000402 [Pleurodeles waltl]
MPVNPQRRPASREEPGGWCVGTRTSEKAADGREEGRGRHKQQQHSRTERRKKMEFRRRVTEQRCSNVGGTGGAM